MKLLSLGVVFALLGAVSADEKRLKVDFAGEGRSEPVLVRRTSETLPAKLVVIYREQTLDLGEMEVAEWPKMQVVAPFAGSKRQMLAVSTEIDGGDINICRLIGLRAGKPAVLASFDGIDEAKVQGNDSVVTTRWMGFWTLTQKWALATDGQAKLVPQEFYAVRVQGTVKRTFPLLMARASTDVVARLREGSKVEVLLRSGPLPTSAAESNVKRDEWYLIQSEGGLIGWLPGHLIQDHLELPWAG